MKSTVFKGRKGYTVTRLQYYDKVQQKKYAVIKSNSECNSFKNDLLNGYYSKAKTIHILCSFFEFYVM